MSRPAAACRCPLPEQEVDTSGEEWELTYRELLPVEEWNAQMSLLTGFAAASLMMYARVGFLRTLPPPDPRDVQRLHRTAHALGIDVAGRAALPRLHPHPRRGQAAARRDDLGLHQAAAGERVRRLRRRDPGPAAAQRAQRRVRPRHRSAAPARRPVRLRGVRRVVRRGRGAGLGAGPRCPRWPGRCRSPPSAPAATSGWSSTWSRPACCSTASARASRPSWSR